MTTKNANHLINKLTREAASVKLRRPIQRYASISNRKSVPVYDLLLLILPLSYLPPQALADGHDHSPTHLAVTKVLEERFQIIEGWQHEVNRPYFDVQGKLRWNSSPIKSSTTPCISEQFEHWRRTLVLNPRVDYVGCARNDGVYGEKRFLVGLDSEAKIAWQRQLGFVSGEYIIEEYVAGASQLGILIDNLTLLSPKTGKVLIPAKLRPDHHKPPLRPVPLHQVSMASAYLPDRKGFLTFTADVTLAERSGGIYFIDEATGQKELWLPVSVTPMDRWAIFVAPWNIEEMVEASGGRFVFLAQRFGGRGTARVSIAVFDTKSRKIVYEDRFGKDECCEFPQVVAGPGGNFGFAYLDRVAGKRVLIHYRLPEK